MLTRFSTHPICEKQVWYNTNGAQQWIFLSHAAVLNEPKSVKYVRKCNGASLDTLLHSKIMCCLIYVCIDFSMNCHPLYDTFVQNVNRIL